MTTRWTGAVGIIGYYLPALSWGSAGLEVGDVPLAHAYQPTMDLLAAARRPTVVLAALMVVGVYLLLRRRVGAATALVAAALLALDPFFVALSRVLHHDALNAMFALLAVLCFAEALAGGRRRWYVAAGVAAGLAFLSKSPAVVLPLLVAVVALVCTVARPKEDRRWNRIVPSLALMTGAMTVTTFALWPAAWVDPVGALRGAFDTASLYAASPHMHGNFFWGRPVSDPGPLFYPVVLLFRGSPLTLAGAAVSLAFLPAWWKQARRSDSPLPMVLALWGLAGAYVVMMTLGAKKGDRYALPPLVAFDVVAALGWVALLDAVRRRWLSAWRPLRTFRAAVGLGTLAALASAALCLSCYPYYLTYYNPVLGGGATAVKVLVVGWGEGVDQAVRYLDSVTGGRGARVGWAYAPLVNFGPYRVNAAFPPEPQRNNYPWAQLDYVVTYVANEQRQLTVAPAFSDLFDSIAPEFSARLGSIEYAKVYRIRPEAFLSLSPQATPVEAEYPEQVRLAGYRLRPMEISASSARTVPVTLYWQVHDPCAKKARLKLKLVNWMGTIWASTTDSVPWGYLSCKEQRPAWRGDLIFPDEHVLSVYPGTPPGSYQVDVALSDYQTNQNRQPLDGQRVMLGPVEIPREEGLRMEQVDMDHAVGATLGGCIRLLGYNVAGSTKAGQRLEFTAFWQCVAPIEESYKVFLHVVDKEGRLVAQQDGEPVTGFYPTNSWHVGEIVRDQHVLTFTDDQAATATGFRLGLYQPVTGERLAVSLSNGKAGEDNAIALP